MNARTLALGLAAAALGAVPALAQQQDFSKVQIEPQKVAEGIYMLTGSGGNIGLLTGSDGAFLIDDQFAPLSAKILAAVKTLTAEPLRFVVNTHWHGDHTGGNENMGLAGAGAIIVAQENVRRRMSAEHFNPAFNNTTPASPPDALPVVTFVDAVTFHWNGQTVRVFHVEPAHTDGDSIIQFEQANVFHMGDTFFNGSYPYIDVSSGGRIDGMISAAERVLKVATDETRLIPGHGPLGTKADLQAYHDMLRTVRNRIAALEAQGKTKEEIVAAKPTADLDAKWGGGFMKPDNWVGLVYDSMS